MKLPRRITVAVCAAACALAGAAGAAEAPATGRWVFRALLDGKPIRAHRFVVTPEAGGLRVESAASFDALRSQSSLLNVQTGRFESVRVEPQRAGVVEVEGGRRIPALPYRISGTARPIVVWYPPEGAWVGLDATVDGGRKLIYRLEASP